MRNNVMNMDKCYSSEKLEANKSKEIYSKKDHHALEHASLIIPFEFE
jgi:hypothetical protein